ncbi:MAG: ECF transporter S component [Clostridia bacterium]|nr:ECF transporter S component [Clostridia bacterium]
MQKNSSVRKIAVTAIMSAMAVVLMFLDFSIPIMPSFIKLDFSELPALITSFALGPVWGIAVCFIKNLIVGLLKTQTGYIGELSNFILGATFVAVAGFVYKHKKSRKTAFIGALIGALAMAAISLPSNYFIIYPIYTKMMPIEAILEAYQSIYHGATSLFKALLIFNVPFTFFKGLCNTLLTFLIYKKISPILKGKEI